MKEYIVKFKQAEDGWHWYLNTMKVGEANGFCFTLFDAMNEAYVVMKHDLNLTQPTSW